MEDQNQLENDTGQQTKEEENAYILDLLKEESSKADDMEEEEVNSAEGSDASDPIDLNNLPDYACNYCGISSPECVLKCTAKNCGRWFCNGKGKSKLGSHIILHLVKAKHKEVSLHAQGLQGEMALECYICGNKNVFLLGFVSIQGGEKQGESQVIVICRLPCLNLKRFNEFIWDPVDFVSLIEEKQFVPWVVRPPESKQMRKARQATLEQIVALEELRKTRPQAEIKDIENMAQRQKVVKDVLLKYVDGRQYFQIFKPLIEMEAMYDKKIKESQTQSGITVR